MDGKGRETETSAQAMKEILWSIGGERDL